MAVSGFTVKEQAFIEGVLLGKAASRAHEDAGYKASTRNSRDSSASQLLRKPKIAAELARRRTQVAAKVNVNAEWVITKLIANYERAVTGSQILDEDGDPSGFARYEGSVANRALELIGKHIGMFRERHEITGKDGSAIETKSTVSVGLTDEMREQIRTKLLGLKPRGGEKQ